MKKFYLCALALIGSISVSSAFAANTPSIAEGYHAGNSNQGPSAKKLTSKATTGLPPTYLTIVNAVNDVLYASVVGTTATYTVEYHKNEHIWHGSYAGNTNIAITDRYNHLIFTGEMCRYAIVTVYPDYINVDNDPCYF